MFEAVFPFASIRRVCRAKAVSLTDRSGRVGGGLTALVALVSATTEEFERVADAAAKAIPPEAPKGELPVPNVRLCDREDGIKLITLLLREVRIRNISVFYRTVYLQKMGFRWTENTIMFTYRAVLLRIVR